MTVNQDVMNAIIEQLTISYTVACKTVPTQNIAIVAAALADALDLSDAAEVREAFRRARMVQDIPTQRTLADGLKNIRMERMPQAQAIEHDESRQPVGKRLVTNEQRAYILATHSLCGTGPKMTNDREIVEAFEADPKKKEFVEYQRGWLRKWRKPLLEGNAKKFKPENK